MIHSILDRLNRPRHSEVGNKLPVIGRLTYGWLWIDSKVASDMHTQQDAKEELDVKRGGRVSGELRC